MQKIKELLTSTGAMLLYFVLLGVLAIYLKKYFL